MDVSRLDGVGPRKIQGLHALGIESLYDLLSHYPRRYIDRSRQRRISDLEDGEEYLIVAKVASVISRRTRNRKAMVVAEFRDSSGVLRATFFNQPWRERQLSSQDLGEVAVFGKVESFGGRRQMTNPVVDPLGTRTGRIVAIYPLSERSGLSTWELRSWVAQVLRRSRKRGISDPVPSEILQRFDLVSRADAIEGIHAPRSMDHLVLSRRRLVFDELLRIQLALVQRKREIERTSKGIAHDVEGDESRRLFDRFIDDLPYSLTGAQAKAIHEIATDLASPVPMHRLLQGDVGAGKTLVAVAAMLMAVQGGHQGALMAPTEVLAEQHVRSIRETIGPLSIGEEASLLGERPVSVALLTGRTRAADRRRILSDLAAGRVDILVGTHALIEESVQFSSLGVVVVDEQHRFGVEQRAALRASNADGSIPDVLVMTATPIPRTAAMTVYGDLDVTTLDELPPGRTPVKTTWDSSPYGESTWELVRREVAAGHQAFVVCPLVEGSEKVEAASAEETHHRLAEDQLSGLKVGLLHGRMSSDAKDSEMARFRSAELDVLVATTVIEVGVDVPNASVMVIVDADRFGLAQLHQLRGRVGRGAAESHCVLITGSDLTEDGQARIDAMLATTDGFVLAEVDLELRGEGTLMAERQKGRNDLRLASLRRDREWVELARDAAFDIVGDGTHLDRGSELAVEVRILLDEDEREFLVKS